jgi:hypothetical protein
MVTRNPSLPFRAALLGACVMLGACSSSQRAPDTVKWTPSAMPVDADRYDYLGERQANVLSLVVKRLSEESDPAVRAALSCMWEYPPVNVVAGEVRLDALRDLIVAALAAMPAAADECAPLATEWRYTTLGALCPVASGHHFRLATDVTLSSGAKHPLTGNAFTAHWKGSAWAYRKARDEAFAAGLSEAMLAMAKTYAAALQITTPPETP